jgi:hypothetical protein
VDATGGRGAARRPQRFNDLLGQIPGIAANILSERLKRLERDGLLIARPYSERPSRAAYQLTAEGTELAGSRNYLVLTTGSPVWTSSPTRCARWAANRLSCAAA